MYKPEGKIGTYIGHPVEVVSLNPNDVIVLHLAEDVDLDCANAVVKDLKTIFPNNPVLCKHPSIIENITIVKQEDKNFEQPFLSHSWG